NRYYARVNGLGVRGHAVRDLDRHALAPLLADPDAPFATPGVRVLKDSRSSTVVEFDLGVGGQLRHVVYKRFRVTAGRDPWVALVRPTAALRSWMFGQGLRERCLPTARPLAVLHRMRGGRPAEAYLLTEKIEGAVDLHGFARQTATGPIAHARPGVRLRL